MKLFFYVFFILFSVKSNAWMLDLNSDLVTESFKTASEQKNSRQFFLLGALGDLGRYDKTRYYLGWSVISAATQDTNEAANIDQKFSTMDMGPILRIGFGSRGLYSLTLVYSLFAQGKLDTNGASEKLTGSSYLAKFSMEPEVTENFRLGFGLNYYAAQYSKSVSNSVETDVSYKMQRMFPSLSLSYGF